MNRKPNILFILADDLGWMDTSLTGSEYYETPNLQRLAKEGMFFSSAYACPLCSPTRATIMTGKYAHRLHLTKPAGHLKDNNEGFNPYMDSGPAWQETCTENTRTALPLSEKIIAEYFKNAGYETGIVGKVHLGKEPCYEMKNRGFKWDMGVHNPGPPSYYPPYRMPKFDNGYIEGEYITDRLARDACNFIDNNKENPFLLFFWHFAVHAPFHGKKEYIEYFKNKKDPRNKQGECYHMAAMIKSMDDAVGFLIDKLEETNLKENTIIIFASDNGGNEYNYIQGHFPTNNYPLRQGKGTIYEGGIRVPVIIRWPGVTDEGSVCSEIIHAVDFFPTMMDMAGIAPDEDQIMDGLSLRPILENNAGTLNRKGVVTHFVHNVPAPGNTSSSAINSGDWKLIRNYELCGGRKVRYELYNLQDDISETINLADNYPDKVKELEALLDENLKETGCMAPKKNPRYDATQAIPESYTWWLDWTDEFIKDIQNDPSVKDYPKVITESSELALAERLRGTVTVQRGRQDALLGASHVNLGRINGLPLEMVRFGLEAEFAHSSERFWKYSDARGFTIIGVKGVAKPIDCNNENDKNILDKVYELICSFANSDIADWLAVIQK